MESNSKTGLDEKGEAVVPNFCEFVIKRNGEGYDSRHWDKVEFFLYSNNTFFIQCRAVDEKFSEYIEFRGKSLKTYTTYVIKDTPAPEEGFVSADIILKEFLNGSYTLPEGTFEVRGLQGEGMGMWFIGKFYFSFTFMEGEEETKYEIESSVFQVQVNHFEG